MSRWVAWVALVAAGCAVATSHGFAAAAGPEDATRGTATVATRFVSKQYGYTLVLPRGWRGYAATTSFPGGDIDHTASYADTFSAPDTRGVFALDRRTKKGLAAFARAHGKWLTSNRPCRQIGSTAKATLAGTAAIAATYTCNPGVYGPTYVVKWVTVRWGRGLIFTQFSPDGNRAADRAVLAGLLRGLAWKP